MKKLVQSLLPTTQRALERKGLGADTAAQKQHTIAGSHWNQTWLPISDRH